MEGFYVKDLLALIAIFLAGGLFLWVRILTKRAFLSIDTQIKGVTAAIEKVETRIACIESNIILSDKEIVKITEGLKTIDEIKQAIRELVAFRSEVQDRYQRKSEFVRESQIISNQIESLHKKLEYLDSKMDRKGST